MKRRGSQDEDGEALGPVRSLSLLSSFTTPHPYTLCPDQHESTGPPPIFHDQQAVKAPPQSLVRFRTWANGVAKGPGAGITVSTHQLEILNVCANFQIHWDGQEIRVWDTNWLFIIFFQDINSNLEWQKGGHCQQLKLTERFLCARPGRGSALLWSSSFNLSGDR